MSPKITNTRQSYGVSTSATESKGALKQASQAKSIDHSKIGEKRQFEFSRLVNSIMTNPFSHSGMNP